MTTVGFVSWKGGTGKSLLAFNTAERATAAGVKTLLCDFDPQMTMIEQCDIRNSLRPEAPRLEVVKGSLTIEGIEALRRTSQDGEYDLLICDLPGADTFTMDQALAAMDLLLIPITAAPFEIMTTAKLVHKGIVRGWEMILVPNNLPAIKARRKILLTTLTGMGIEIAPVALVRRVSHWDATLAGQAVCEYAPTSPAAEEILAFWSWLEKRIDIRSNTHATTVKEPRYA